MTRFAALSVDLDEIAQYRAIHGLDVESSAAPRAVYARAVPRFEAFAAAHAIPLTWFVIGADARDEHNAEVLRRLSAAGHELGNHSLDHRYDLTRLAPAEMQYQVEQGAATIAAATGTRPRGFRAPGYTVTDTLLKVVERSGHAYDSSVFPSPPYYLAKLAAFARIRWGRRRSASILDRPGVLAAPTRPYRIGCPYYRPGTGLVELPIQVTRGLRLPFIGTALALSGPVGARALCRMVVGEPLVNLELHGIDALDVDDDLAALAPHQPDVRVPVSRKLTAFAAVVAALKQAGYAFVTLAEAALVFEQTVR